MQRASPATLGAPRTVSAEIRRVGGSVAGQHAPRAGVDRIKESPPLSLCLSPCPCDWHATTTGRGWRALGGSVDTSEPCGVMRMPWGFGRRVNPLQAARSANSGSALCGCGSGAAGRGGAADSQCGNKGLRAYGPTGLRAKKPEEGPQPGRPRGRCWRGRGWAGRDGMLQPWPGDRRGLSQARPGRPAGHGPYRSRTRAAVDVLPHQTSAPPYPARARQGPPRGFWDEGVTAAAEGQGTRLGRDASDAHAYA